VTLRAPNVIKSTKDWVKLLDVAEEKINFHLNQITTVSRSQKISVEFTSLNFSRIVNGLKVFIPLSDKGRIDILNNIIKEDGWQRYFENPDAPLTERKLKDNIEVMLMDEQNHDLEDKIRVLLRIIQKLEFTPLLKALN
jgi:hypothetical protein